MAKNYINEAEETRMTLTVAVSAGEGVISGNLVGIAQQSGEIGDDVTVLLEGRFSPVAKKTGTAWTKGDNLYWDETNAEWTKVSTDGTFGAIADEDALSAATTGTIILRGNTPDAAVDLSAYAQLDSPAFINNPSAPTQAPGTNDTKLANTAFVVTEIAARVLKKTHTLSTGTVTQASPSINAGSTGCVQLITRGGTFAAHGYRLTLNVGSGYTVTALDSSDVAEAGCTDSVVVTIFI